MKRAIASICLAFVLLSIFPLNSSIAVPPVPGTKCSKSGLVQTYNGKKYTCIKLGTKLYWDNGKKISLPRPSNSAGATTMATSSPTPISSPAAITSSDIQFIYGTATSCGNEIGYARFNSIGKLLARQTIVKANQDYVVEPQDYYGDELLFITRDCGGTTSGKKSELWSLNLGNKSSKPKKLYSLTINGTRDGFLIGSKWDPASGKALIFTWISGDQKIMTAESNPLVIWSASKQGWLASNQWASDFDASTGYNLNVFGGSTSNWKSIYVDWRTQIEGIGTIVPRQYGSPAQFTGKGVLTQVSKGILGMPYAFAIDGLYVCVDFPTTYGSIVDVSNNDRCTRVAGYQTSIAFTFYADPEWSNAQAIISAKDMKAYAFKSGPIFGTWSPIDRFKTIDLSAMYGFGVVTDLVSAFETSFNIAVTSPTLNYSGYFY